MKQMRLKIFMLAILMFIVGLAACNKDSVKSKNDKVQLAEIGKFLDVEFPADARIVSSEKNANRRGEVAYFYIIYTPMPVKFNMQPVAEIAQDTLIKILERHVKRKKLGKLCDDWTYCYEGGWKNGTWIASQTNFETGSYLYIQRSF